MIGWIIGWNLPESISDIEDKDWDVLNTYGIVPPSPNPRRALQEAVRQLDGELSKSNWRCRLVKPPAFPDHRWVLLVQVLDPQDRKSIKLQLRAVVGVSPDSIVFSEYQGGVSFQPIRDRLEQLYHHIIRQIYVPDLTKQCIRFLYRAFGALRLNKIGGTYYIPISDKAFTFLNQWKAFGERIGGTVYIFDVAGRDFEIRVIARLFLEHLNEVIHQARVRLRQNMRAETASRFAEELADVMSHIELYQQVIGLAESAVADAKSALADILSQITEAPTLYEEDEHALSQA